MEKLITLPSKGGLMIVGDVHGDIVSLELILEKFYKGNDKLLFLGDYGDRGFDSPAVYETLFDLLKKHPDRVYLLKGNHENFVKEGSSILPKFYPHDFFSYLQKFKPDEILKYFAFWESLPICALAPKKYLFLHGGVSSKIKSLDDLKNPSEEIETDILWSDPAEDDVKGEQYNPRGAGVLFGKDITREVCEALGVKTIIRSHQPYLAKNGAATHHDNRLLTISSTTVYDGKAAYLRINLGDRAKDAYELSKMLYILSI